MSDDAPVLDYGTGTPNSGKDFDVVESPGGAVSLVIPPRPPWRTAVAVTCSSLATAGFVTGATAIVVSQHFSARPLAALFALAAFGFAHHALSRFLSRKTPTVLSVAADGVTISEPSWYRPRVRWFPHADMRPLRLRDLGPGLTLRRVGELCLVPHGTHSPIYLCRGPHATLAQVRNRLDLALERYSEQQGGSRPTQDSSPLAAPPR